jgi:hypothetical protein
MTRARICLAMGLACVLIGAALALFAVEMASGGAASSQQESAYRHIGLGVLGLGLLLEALACSRWMASRSEAAGGAQPQDTSPGSNGLARSGWRGRTRTV